MISILGFLLDLAVWVLLAALTVGLISGFAVLIWRWGRETLFFAHGFVLSWGDHGVALAMESIRERFPSILPEDKSTTEHARHQAEINSLQCTLATAQGRAAELSALVEDLRRQLGSADGGPHQALFGSVGLHPGAPDFLLFAARREFRRRLHPDTQPPGRKTEFTRKFQNAEQAFSEIWSLRDLK